MSAFSDRFEPYGSGRKAPVGGLSDPALLTRLQRYKRLVAKRYRVVDAGEMERVLPKGKLWMSTKVDGELWFLVKEHGEVALCAYNGRVLQDIAVVAEAAKLLERHTGLERVVIAGELFALTKEGRPRVHHVGKALGDGKLADTLGFKAFDLVEENGEDRQGQSYDLRYTRLNELFEGGRRASVVTTAEGTAPDALTYYTDWVASQKFEGLIVRSEQGFTFKVKPNFTIDAIVVAFGERLAGDTPQVRELSVALRRPDGSLQLLGPVGGGFSEVDRITWHERLTALKVSSAYRLANREGTLCHFVRPEIVVEVKVADLLDEGAVDEPVTRMLLNYDPAVGYTTVGLTRFAAMLFPVLMRERTDKLPDEACAGIDQVLSRLQLPGTDEVIESYAPVAATVIKRAAYIKETKGQTAVRKYVAIATNKADQPGWPAYVVHFTDFSAGRAEPLKTAMRVASTEAHVDAHIAAWVEENIKKGWTLAT